MAKLEYSGFEISKIVHGAVEHQNKWVLEMISKGYSLTQVKESINNYNKTADRRLESQRKRIEK